jgi:hypothetical protein
MLIEKPTRFRSAKKLRWVGTLGCCICGQEAVPHHLLRGTGHGMGLKAGDDAVIPMCHQHHMALHAAGDETKFLQSHGIDGPALARRLHQEWSER